MEWKVRTLVDKIGNCWFGGLELELAEGGINREEGSTSAGDFD